MADITLKNGGGGTSSDEVTALKANVLAGTKTITRDSNDEIVEGTMVNQGAKTQALNCGGSYTIPAGYHNGSGKVTANSLASQTSANATAAQILAPNTAYANGTKLTGTMVNQGAKTQALNCGGSYTIPAGYHNGSGKVTANSLASQTSATATAGHVLKDKTAYANGSKITGTLAITSAINFSAAARSHDTIRITWTNPSKGPFQGVQIRYSTSAYPGTSGGTLKYTGTGSSTTAGGTSYVDITGLSTNTTYYFTCYSYVTNLGIGTSANVTATTTAYYLYNRGSNPAGFVAYNDYVRFNSNNIQSAVTTLANECIIKTNTVIDFTKFTKIHLRINTTSQNKENLCVRVQYRKPDSTTNNGIILNGDSYPYVVGERLVSFDLTKNPSTYSTLYIRLSSVTGNTGGRWLGYIYEIYLT